MASIRKTIRERLAAILATITFESSALTTFSDYKRNNSVKPYVFFTDNGTKNFELMDTHTYFMTYQFIGAVVLSIPDTEAGIASQLNRFAELEELITDKLLSQAVRDGVAYSTDKWKDVKITNYTSPMSGKVLGLDDTDAVATFNIDIEMEKAYS